MIELAPNLFPANPNDFIAHRPVAGGYRPMPDQTLQYLLETYLAR